MSFDARTLIPFYGVKYMVDNWKHNLSDGYQFGDIVSGEAGFKRKLDFGEAGLSSSSAQDVENRAKMSEREFSLYMTKYAHDLGVKADATKYQRAYKDLVNAGLNPRLAIEALNGNGVNASSAYSTSESKGESKSFSSSALIAALVALAIKAMM